METDENKLVSIKLYNVCNSFKTITQMYLSFPVSLDVLSFDESVSL